MTTAGSAGPRPLTSPMLVPGQGHPWCAIDCWAVAATLDGQLQRRRSRHRQAVLKELVGWHCGAATQRPGTDRRTLCVHQATATPASKCTVHQNYVCPSVPTQNGRWGGGAEPSLSRLSPSQWRTAMKDARPWQLYMPPGMCGNVMFVCHSIRRMDLDNSQLLAVDIKALADVDTASRCVVPHPCWFYRSQGFGNSPVSRTS